ncbi:hypothetical protein BJ166DRAFT_166147 [Pestalotiopsis sp. NC0098]|nr:hypothetical protein BJ166DRAFT_166147 [Pestalotiopsis sp. NC0098]
MVHRPEKEEPLPEENRERYEPFAALKRSANYEFGPEIFEGLFKVSRKSDRFEFLARDETARLQDANGNPSTLATLLHFNGLNFMTAIMRLLNHENLINIIDWIEVQTAPDASLTLPQRHFFIWDYCNAGTLENLLFREKRTPKTELHLELEERERKEEEEIMADADPNDLDELRSKKKNEGPQPFMPEAFCWHVLCSVLSALAWLHHGVRREWNFDENDWEVKRASIDWQTTLHRNIKPSTIWFCHPQTKFETYGLCKLGNFKHAYITGVFNGVLENTMQPALEQIAMAPQRGEMSHHEDLLSRYEKDPVHPPKTEQTYTMTNEYRSLVDVVYSMMVQPIAGFEANRHWSSLVTQDDSEWWDYLNNAPYTNALKTFLTKLMAERDHFDPSDRAAMEHRKEMTWNLYLEAEELYETFRTVKEEGKEVITALHVQIEHYKRGRRAADEAAAEEKYEQDMVKYLKTSNRFIERAKPITPLESLLGEIQQACKEADESEMQTNFEPDFEY